MAAGMEDINHTLKNLAIIHRLHDAAFFWSLTGGQESDKEFIKKRLVKQLRIKLKARA